tara:strand:+ start:909 stop:1079 length:171 start_codon:yes stop_codon:yes gene_type:complete
MKYLESQLIKIKLREIEEVLFSTNKMISHVRKLVSDVEEYSKYNETDSSSVRSPVP